MRNASTALALAVCLTAALPAGAYESLRGPTELLHWDKDKAYSGYTLFSARGTSYLIDMSGQVVHTWRIGTTPRLLANGNLLDASKDDPSGFQGFKELDWDGKVVWQHTERREGYAPHHDWVRIFNKKLGSPTTLYIANRSVSQARAVAAGCDPRRSYNGAQVDAVVEVDMQGKVVWEWWFFDHVVQDADPSRPNYAGEGRTVADHPGKINLNLPGRPLRRDWLHCNSLDYNAELGHVVINSVQGEFYVIDHDGTFVAGDPARSVELAAGPKGDFLYRFGDPARYGRGDRPAILEDWTRSTTGHKQIGGSHDVQWIRPGLPGAGNFLIFNNGQYLFERTGQSYIFEIDGFRDSRGRGAGRYVDPPAAGYYRLESPNRDTHKQTKQMSNQVVWIYGSRSNQGFFSHIGSGCQRLPNGNTLICAMTEGHLFEVTREGEVVWEYVNPVTREGTKKVIGDAYPMSNAVFRAYRYGPDHPALKGRDLKPKGTITEAFAVGPSRRGSDRRPGGGRDRGQGGRRGDRRRQAGDPRPGGRQGDRRGRGGQDRPGARRGDGGDVVKSGAKLVEIAGDFQFTEGPAVDANGNVFFADVRASKIHKWSLDRKVTVFRTDTGNANGLHFDAKGNLLACEGGNGRVVSIAPDGQVTVLADKYDGKRFNKPNDLWIAAAGGVYFSDPMYGRGTPRTQEGEHVYYITPDRNRVLRVIDDMVRPNGLVGPPDGKTLYVTDHGGRKTFRYDVKADGTLANKKLFAPFGGDGMTIDERGNVYLAEEAVLVFDPTGKQIARIDVPVRPTNVCFAGRDGRTLFITARSSVYTIQMRVRGATAPARKAPPDKAAPPERAGGGPGRARPPAGDDRRGGGPRRGRGGGRSRHPVILALDADGDGEISAAEIDNATASLTKLDTDGDGWLRREELRPTDGGRGPEGRRSGRQQLPGEESKR